MIVPFTPQATDAAISHKVPFTEGGSQDDQPGFASLLSSDPIRADKASQKAGSKTVQRGLLDPTPTTSKGVAGGAVPFEARGMFGQGGALTSEAAPDQTKPAVGAPDDAQDVRPVVAETIAASDLGARLSIPSAAADFGQSAASGPATQVPLSAEYAHGPAQSVQSSYQPQRSYGQDDPPGETGSTHGRAPIPNRQLSAGTKSAVPSLTVTETLGALTIVMRGVDGDARDRMRLRWLAERAATGLGLSIDKLLIDGAPQPRTPVTFGEHHGS